MLYNFNCVIKVFNNDIKKKKRGFSPSPHLDPRTFSSEWVVKSSLTNQAAHLLSSESSESQGDVGLVQERNVAGGLVRRGELLSSVSLSGGQPCGTEP